MGIGDEIMASGHARELHESTGKRVVIGRNGQPRWSEVWEGVPFIAREMGRDTVWLENGPGRRPYYRPGVTGKMRWAEDYEPVPGTISLSHKEVSSADDRLSEAFGADSFCFWVLEPNAKGTHSKNKSWPFERWQKLADLIPYPVLQFKHDCARDWRQLDGVTVIETDFREACAALYYALGVVTTDGALHHAAAALDVPAVVLWGGYTSPDLLGYKSQVNLYPDDPRSPCGELKECEHCREMMERITVEMALEGVLHV